MLPLINYDAAQNAFRPARLTITIVTKYPTASYGDTMVKYDDTQEYWKNFANKWFHTTILSIVGTELTEDQQTRLEMINEQVEQFTDPKIQAHEISDYVQFGAVRDETQTPVLVDLAKSDDARNGNIAQVKSRLLQTLADVRFAREVGGVTLPDGRQIQTDRDAQAQLTSAYMTLKDGLKEIVTWKSVNGWVKINLEEITPLAQTAFNHVQNCFTAEETVGSQLDGFTDISSDEAYASTLEELQSFNVVEAFLNTYQDLMTADSTDAA